MEPLRKRFLAVLLLNVNSRGWPRGEVSTFSAGNLLGDILMCNSKMKTGVIECQVEGEERG